MELRINDNEIQFAVYSVGKIFSIHTMKVL